MRERRVESWWVRKCAERHFIVAQKKQLSHWKTWPYRKSPWAICRVHCVSRAYDANLHRILLPFGQTEHKLNAATIIKNQLHEPMRVVEEKLCWCWMAFLRIMSHRRESLHHVCCCCCCCYTKSDNHQSSTMSSLCGYEIINSWRKKGCILGRAEVE